MPELRDSRIAGPARVARALRFAAIVAVFAAALLLSGQSGAPAHLPGSALGWAPLLHVERASALVGTLGIVLLIGWRAARGEFPIRFGNVEYATSSAETVRTIESLQAQILELRAATLPDRDPEEPDTPNEGLQ